VEWDERTCSVRARTRTRLGAIVLSESTVSNPDGDATAEVLLDVVRRGGINELPWSEEATRLRERITFMHSRHSEWPDVSDDALLATLDDWLPPVLIGRTSLRDMSHDLDRTLAAMLDWDQRARLDKLAPAHYVAPTGSRVAIDYTDPEAPSVAVRLQEMFGVKQTPTVDAGSVALTVQLLSPARRPVQVTRDLAGFWGGSYFEVRKELRGRYPKHVWPDDPLSATPTTRVKRRGE
jgi:ATP-dependent helicase HrpB